MRVTKDRVYNDFRQTLKEIVDVKNGKAKADGKIKETYTDNLSNISLNRTLSRNNSSKKILTKDDTINYSKLSLGHGKKSSIQRNNSI